MSLINKIFDEKQLKDIVNKKLLESQYIEANITE